MKPIFLNAEQATLIDEVKAFDERFGANARLFHSVSAIAAAKALIDRAVTAGLDQRAFYPLQAWISLHETEQSMPAHLRTWQPIP